MKTNSVLSVRHRAKSAGLTLIELIVVIAVLAVLAALIVPRLSGVTNQADSAAKMDLVTEINKAVTTYEARNRTHARTWDNLVPQSGTALFTKLNPSLVPRLTVLTLDAVQAKSLTDAGITGAMTVSETAATLPSDAAVSDHTMVATGAKFPAIVKQTWAGHGSTFLDKAFNVLPTFPGGVPPTTEFVVLGVGQSSTLRGSVMTDAPIVHAANPMKYYARMLCVFRVPATGATVGFPAQYVGSFMPDGTCAKDNADAYLTSVASGVNN
jgi:prepilin-type N-terminal cleavage/methylation domain-containing protein